ncbi:MAG: CCA tRNA nucleotidyltransferase [Candidatus Methanomethylicota archaeon]|uniref:CCA-adding enzyme n=1 Tax=Thermoproteota archaeon TaxID=2056631 RepID=A0A497EWR6_9CREN|nr:MAG: CCA tRNA nucleotidyltransferase [Candidatus Verstraetearchaeota archaeon]
MSKVEEVINAVLKKVRPSAVERKAVNRVVSEVLSRIKNVASRLGFEVEVRVEGSIAKDTWISGDRDIDVFIRLPKEIGREGLESIGLRIAREAAGDKWIECYAEHPYVEAEIYGFTVDLVPCFMVSSAEEATSAVDRTPFHTDYINSHLSGELKDEVRLLKQFMKGIDVYGAEVKVQGFSGYLCELLILHYKSFIRVLEAAAYDWKPYSTVIDIENYYADSDEPLALFKAPLVVVDPVDKRRNVAAALSLQKMCEFIAASKAFIKSPDLKFFYPPPIMPLNIDEVLREIEKRGTDFVFIVTRCPKASPDVLWGQFYKSVEGIRRLLEVYDFKVIDCAVWSDESKYLIFMFELESACLPALEKHLGPPVYSREHSERFIEKYLEVVAPIAGPKIEGDRWVVYLKRKYFNACDLIGEKLLEARLGKLVYSELSRGFQIMLNEEVSEIYRDLRDFAVFFTRYLFGKPRWLL